MSKCHFLTVTLLSLYQSETLLQCHYVKASLYQSVTLLQCHYIKVSLCQSVTLSQCHYSTVSLYYSVTISECRFSTVSLYHKVLPCSCVSLFPLYASKNAPLYGPCQYIMQVNVHLRASQPHPVLDCQVPAVVGQVGVPGGPHLAQHGVQAHEEDGRVNSTPDHKMPECFNLFFKFPHLEYTRTFPCSDCLKENASLTKETRL